MNTFTKVASALLLSLVANFAAAGGDETIQSKSDAIKAKIDAFKDVKSVNDLDDEKSKKDGEQLLNLGLLKNGYGPVPPANGPGRVQPVPVPAAIWLMGAGLVGLLGLSRRGRA